MSNDDDPEDTVEGIIEMAILTALIIQENPNGLSPNPAGIAAHAAGRIRQLGMEAK